MVKFSLWLHIRPSHLPSLLKCKMFCTLFTRFYTTQNASFNVDYIQNSKMSGFYSLPFASMAAKTSGIYLQGECSCNVWRHFHGCGKVNTAAKHLCMHQVEHFWSLFQSHFSVRLRSPAHAQLHSVCSLWFSCSASCCFRFWLYCTYWNCFHG